MVELLIYIGLAVTATAVVWKGSGNLERAADNLAAYYRLPAVVQGAIIAAIGSSFPELSATVLSTLVHGQFDLGVAAIVGSATFNILVIPGLAGLVGGQLSTELTLVYKDAQFYITAVIVLLLSFSFAVIYNPAMEGTLVGVMDRPIAAIPFLLYGVYVFMQHQDVVEHRADWEPTEGSERKPVHPRQEWMRLGIGLVLILIGVEGLVRSAIGFGELLATPAFLWGLTVVAIGTSLPDAFISIRAAQQGYSTVSLANVLGSNIFDLLIAVPAGVLIAGAVAVDFAVAVPMMGFLTLASIILFAMLRTKLTLSRNECVVLIVLYVVFVIWVTVEKIGLYSLFF